MRYRCYLHNVIIILRGDVTRAIYTANVFFVCDTERLSNISAFCGTNSACHPWINHELENHSSRTGLCIRRRVPTGRIFTGVHDRAALNRVLFAANSTRNSIVIERGWLDYKVKSSAGGETAGNSLSSTSECVFLSSAASRRRLLYFTLFFSLFRPSLSNALCQVEVQTMTAS